MPEFVIGCPVLGRDWILPKWFEWVRGACTRANITPSYVFVGSKNIDISTYDIIRSETKQHNMIFLETGETQIQKDRVWGLDRYLHMEQIRNKLLSVVRSLEPKYFLSLDSDILIHPQGLTSMIETAEKYDAVGGRTYMTPDGVRCPSMALQKKDGGLRRVDSGGVFTVDVIMAIKLMKPKAYDVDYTAHRYGEDIGWSRSCRDAGLKLGWDGRYISKHILHPTMLNKIDPRVGW